MNHQTNVKVAVIIPFYNGHRYINALLDSLRTQTYSASEILFVDNSPTQNHLKIDAAAFKPLKISVIRTEAGIGFGRAANVAQLWASERKIPYALLLNQDATLRRDVIENAVKVAVETNAAIVGGVEIDPRDALIPMQYQQWYLNAFKAQNPQKEEDLKALKPAFTRQVCGAAMLIDLIQAREIGGFDPVFHMYGEDTELCSRLIEHNAPLLVSPQFVYYHAHSHLHSSGLERRQIIVWSRQGRVIREMKTNRWLPTKLLRILVRRGAEHFYDILKYRDVESARMNFASDRSLLQRRKLLLRLHRNETPSVRAWRIAQKDLSSAKV